jgi:hypothetical protein
MAAVHENLEPPSGAPFSGSKYSAKSERSTNAKLSRRMRSAKSGRPLRRSPSLGFEEIGIHRRHGQLDDRWRDCVIVELLLPRIVPGNPAL